MRYIREASEDEVIWQYLKWELCSARFQTQIERVLRAERYDRAVIEQADLSSPEQNRIRRLLLARFRGYGVDEEMFENFPERIRWSFAACEDGDLEKIRYVNYSYWDELSNSTHLAAEAAKSVRAGKTVFEVSNEPFLEGERFLRQGGRFPPMIMLGDGTRYVVVEGHSRLTVYGLAPEYFPGTECYLGCCTPEELVRWNGGE